MYHPEFLDVVVAWFLFQHCRIYLEPSLECDVVFDAGVDDLCDCVDQLA